MTHATTLPVLVPAPAEQAVAVIAQLRERDLVVDHAPFLELRPQRDADTRHALAALTEGRLRHLVLTHPTSLEVVASEGASPDLAGQPPVAQLPAGLEITAVGEDTAHALRERGLTPTRVTTTAELLAAPPEPETPGAPLLLAGISALDPSFAPALSSAGHAVTALITHRVRSASLEPQIVRDLRLPGYGAIVLTDPLVADLAGHLGIHRDIRVITRDAETSARARARSLVVHGEAAAPDAGAFADAVQQALRTEIDHG
ncbi:uroporphyrinogen-III synthase [Brachybacterium sp.]|uniref:uroporphyrinogen-III synthase n=1 Tax=Brachybacterium sp. TaxID=1891286 RepID=UPI002ED53DA3